MIFIVLLGISILLIILTHFIETYTNTDVEMITLFLAAIIIVVTIFAGIFSFAAYIRQDATIAKYQIKYDILVYQLNDGAYDNVIDYNRKDLFNDIIKYNSDVMRGRINHENMWLKVFYPEDWDSLPLIELENYDSSN